MNPNATISLCAVCDNDYTIMLAALLKSIEVHHTTHHKIHVYFVCDKVANSTKQKLSASIQHPNITISFHDMYTALPANTRLPLDSSLFPLNVYMRLYIPHFTFIDASVERVIYIDVDMICEIDIADLFFTNMQGKTIAAVLDARVPRFDNSWGGILNYKELNLPPDAPYFNAGIYIIDMLQWRANNYTEKVVDIIDNNTKFANYPDQYGLNIAFTNNWHMLDNRYNHFSSEPYTEPPFIIHYVSRKPIYKTYSGLPELKTTFYKYLHQTAYKGFTPIGESSRYIKKLGIVWSKIKAKLLK